MKANYEEVEGWYQFFKMPASTMHIAYFYESGSVYLPENGLSYADWMAAVRDGHIQKLVVVDRLPEVPETAVGSKEVYEVIQAAIQKHSETIIKDGE